MDIERKVIVEYLERLAADMEKRGEYHLTEGLDYALRRVRGDEIEVKAFEPAPFLDLETFAERKRTEDGRQKKTTLSASEMNADTVTIGEEEE